MRSQPMRIDRVVLDTNILVSALTHPAGQAAGVVAALRRARSLLVFSDPTLRELRDTLSRPKLTRYFTPAEQSDFLFALRQVSEIVTIQGVPMGCRDAGDDMVLETAVRGNADCVVTGDRDLLVMEAVARVPILSPGAFLQRIGPVLRGEPRQPR